MTGILPLLGSLTCSKESKTMDVTLDNDSCAPPAKTDLFAQHDHPQYQFIIQI